MRSARNTLMSLVLAALCLLLAVMPRENPLTTRAEAYQGEIAVAAGATYVSLRAINAFLSAAQEVEVGGSLVVEGSVHPLKWLEPVDDTVERVSAAIFAVAVLTGVLKISLAPVASVGFALLALALLTRGGCEAATGWHRAPPVLRRLGGVCGGLGFAFAIALPLAFVLGVWGGEVLTAEAAAGANGTLDMIAAEAGKLVALEDQSWRESWEAYRGAARFFWEQADDLLNAALTLVGVFLLRMVVLPMVLLLALWAAARRLVAG